MADMDKSESASPYKLQKAREQGQVAKSNEVIAAVVFVVAVTFVSWRGWGAIQEQFHFDQALLAQAGHITLDAATFWHLMHHVAVHYIGLLGPFFATLLIAAVVGNLMQTGPVFSFEPIKPNWERINPVSGFKRMFTMKILFDALKTCIKVVLLAGVVYFALKDLSHRQFYIFSILSPSGYVKAIVTDFSAIGLKMALMLGMIAAVDLVFTRRQFAKQMRMSKRDMKDEVKSRDGDPRIRSRLRRLRREMLKRSLSVQNTSKADVVITNPTHVAIALRYVHGEMESPQLIAKGAGVLAAVMRKIAAKHHIPIVQNRILARKIFHDMDFEQHVPPHLYTDVARIIVWVFAQRRARASMISGRAQAASDIRNGSSAK